MRIKDRARPTLKTISEMTGFSVPTVSRALSDAPEIKLETRELIHQIAKDIGYVPDRAAVRLRTGLTKVICVVISTETDMMNSTARLISAISASLFGTGYHLNIMHSFEEDNSMDSIRYVVETQSADALIINATQKDDPRVAYLIERNFPFTMHGRTKINEENSYFDYDNAEFARIGISELKKRSRNKILIIPPPRTQFYSMEFIKGAQEAAQHAGLELYISESTDTGQNIESIDQSITKTLAEHKDIDGAIIATPNGAMAATAAFERNRYTIGKDFDLVSKDAINFLKLFRKDIIVIEEDMQKAGQFLAAAALKLSERGSETLPQFLDVPETILV